MTHLLTAIVSGGAAGAERGALRAAVDLDLGYGGWSWPEDDVPDVYAARMRPAVSRAMQRRLNVQDSDATLFVMRRGSKEMKFIVDACKTMRKPAKTLTLGDRIPDFVAEAVREWIRDRHISVLNVVGDSDEDATRDALVWMFETRRPYAPGEKMTDRHPNSVIAQTAERVIDDYNAAMDRKERELFEFDCGDPSKPAPVVVGLGEFIPLVAGVRDVDAFVPSIEKWHLGPDALVDLHTVEVGGVVYTQPVHDGIATLGQDAEQCHTCGAKPGESHMGNPGDFGFEPNGQCPTCGAWAAFTEGGTDA